MAVRPSLPAAGTQLVVRQPGPLRGSGRIKVDDEPFELRPLDPVRVARGSAREMEAGLDGLEVLRSHSPGDGRMVADWWTT